MIRRLLSVFAVLLGTVVLAMPVSASTTSQTVHFSSTPDFVAYIPCSSLTGLNVISEDNGNGVMHLSFNQNGFWATGTYTGDLKVQPATNVVFDANGQPVSWDIDTSGQRPTAQGHVTDWFGANGNHNQVLVSSDTVNAQVTTSAGESVSFHMNDHIQVTASGTVLHQFTNAACH